MKVITYHSETKAVRQIFADVYDPKIDRERGVITHANGRIFGLLKEDDHREFIIVDDHIPVELGQIVDDSLLDFDRSHEYDGFTLEDVKEAVEEGIKNIFGDDKDKKND
jgi:hypothetical protein